jgi:hypothetical protein
MIAEQRFSLLNLITMAAWLPLVCVPRGRWAIVGRYPGNSAGARYVIRPVNGAMPRVSNHMWEEET